MKTLEELHISGLTKCSYTFHYSAIFAAVIGTAIGLVLARSDKYANFDPTGDQREQSLVNGMRYTFVGLVFVNFALLVGAFSLAHVKFTNSKEQVRSTHVHVM